MGAEKRDHLNEVLSCRGRWVRWMARLANWARRSGPMVVLVVLTAQTLAGCGGGSNGGSSGPTGPSHDGALFEIVSEQIVRNGSTCPLRISVRNLTSDLIVFTAILRCLRCGGQSARFDESWRGLEQHLLGHCRWPHCDVGRGL
jgi:hypothetical protein